MLEIFHEGSSRSSGILVSDDAPLLFGQAKVGRPSSVVRLDLWNDRNNDGGTTRSPIILVASADPTFLNGTAGNGLQSTIEMRSCEAFNAIADAQQEWSIVDTEEGLDLGMMPPNSKRVIEVRVNLPYDFTPNGQQTIRLLASEE